MSSIIKVNEIQDGGGNTIVSSNGSGTFTSNLPNTGITMADQWRVTADITSNQNPISSNLERVDTSGQGTLGTGMSVSSGYWTFPSTGIYKVEFNSQGNTASGDNVICSIYCTTDNSTYTLVAKSIDGNDSSHYASFYAQTLIDVTDTSLVKVYFRADSMDSGSSLKGSSSVNDTYMTFTRLGDT
jgi:hypothetical protein